MLLNLHKRPEIYVAVYEPVRGHSSNIHTNIFPIQSARDSTLHEIICTSSNDELRNNLSEHACRTTINLHCLPSYNPISMSRSILETFSSPALEDFCFPFNRHHTRCPHSRLSQKTLMHSHPANPEDCSVCSERLAKVDTAVEQLAPLTE